MEKRFSDTDFAAIDRAYVMHGPQNEHTKYYTDTL